MAKVLITGGAGFIGAHVANAAAHAGWDVHILDLVAQHPQIHPKIKFIQGDVRDKGTVEDILSGFEAVVHLAAQISVPDSFADPEKTHSINVEGTQIILEASRKFGVDKVIVASSAAVYGRVASLPLKEDAAGDCISPYAESKWENENQVDLFRNLGLNSIALRFFNVYGPGQSADNSYASVIPKFLDLMIQGKNPTIYGNGKQTRDFIHVDDVAGAIIKLLELDAPYVYSVANVCTEKEHSILDIVSIITKGLNKTNQEINCLFEEPREGDIFHSCGSNGRLRSMISWKPEFNFEDSILKLTRLTNGQ